MYKTSLDNNKYTVISFPDEACSTNIIEQYESYPHLFYAAAWIDIISYVDPDGFYLHFSVEKTSTYKAFTNKNVNYYGINKLLYVLSELNAEYKEINKEQNFNRFDIINIPEFYNILYNNIKEQYPEFLTEIFKNSEINYYKMLFNNNIIKPNSFFYDS